MVGGCAHRMLLSALIAGTAVVASGCDQGECVPATEGLLGGVGSERQSVGPGWKSVSAAIIATSPSRTVSRHSSTDQEGHQMTRQGPPPDFTRTLSVLAVARTAHSSERSLMAWIRTSVSIYSFGFSTSMFIDYLELQASDVELTTSLRRRPPPAPC